MAETTPDLPAGETATETPKKGWLRRLAAHGFYRLFASISDVRLMQGLGDFLLLSDVAFNFGVDLTAPKREAAPPPADSPVAGKLHPTPGQFQRRLSIRTRPLIRMNQAVLCPPTVRWMNLLLMNHRTKTRMTHANRPSN